MADRIVVLVDDERIILDALKAQVRQLFPGVGCETADSVGEALELLDELVDEGTEVVLVVTDWLMPNARGDELLARVRVRHPHIHRVLLTGQADLSALRRVQDESLAHRVLFKPWSTQELEGAVRAALAR